MHRLRLSGVLLWLIVLTAATGFAVHAQESKPPAEPKPPAAEEAPPPEMTADQVYKNIQVFQGMPITKFDRVMKIFNQFLGVECTFCHVENDWANESVKQKQTAREMFRMVQGINHDYPVLDHKVACWTCHRGSSKPESIPPNWKPPAP